MQYATRWHRYYHIGQNSSQHRQDVVKICRLRRCIVQWRELRLGYRCKVVADLVNVRPTEIRSLLQGRLSASRAQELREEMLAAGIPL
jgi:hypothetical protein